MANAQRRSEAIAVALLSNACLAYAIGARSFPHLAVALPSSSAYLANRRRTPALVLQEAAEELIGDAAVVLMRLLP